MKKTLTNLTLVVISLMLFACTNKTENITQAPVSVDSLEAMWDKAWNAHDMEAFSNQLADNVIVFETDWINSGKDSVIKNFVKPSFSHPSTIVMKTTKIVDGVSEGMVYRVGKYVFTKKDSGKIDHKGTFTLIWKKQPDNKWKAAVLQTATIEDAPVIETKK